MAPEVIQQQDGYGRKAGEERGNPQNNGLLTSKHGEKGWFYHGKRLVISTGKNGHGWRKMEVWVLYGFILEI